MSAAVKYYGTFRVERDQSEYRGTGGVLRDLAQKYEPDDLILVANASPRFFSIRLAHTSQPHWTNAMAT